LSRASASTSMRAPQFAQNAAPDGRLAPQFGQ
jgi:hypothetical protein